LEGFGVQSLRIFGSVAREEASADSDVDLLVSFREKATFSSYMKLRIFLEDLLGAKVDLVTEPGLREAVRPLCREGRHSCCVTLACFWKISRRAVPRSASTLRA
jgi:predicted nucleotidyltransferase